MFGERADLCGRCGLRLFEHDVQSRVDRRRRDRMAADRRGADRHGAEAVVARDHRGDIGMSRHAIDLRMTARSEEHTSELPSLMRISYAVFCLKHKNKLNTRDTHKCYRQEIQHKCAITLLQ